MMLVGACPTGALLATLYPAGTGAMLAIVWLRLAMRCCSVIVPLGVHLGLRHSANAVVSWVVYSLLQVVNALHAELVSS